MDREGHAFFKGVKDGSAELYYDNSKKLHTAAGGIDVTGTIDADDVIAINSSSTADLRLQYSANNRLVVRAASSSANIITQNNSDLAFRHDSGTGSGTIIASVDAYGLNTGNNKRLQIKDNNGDVSGVIENWDSSANALKIGADPSNSAGGSYISLQVDGSEQARIGNGISFNGDSATANFLNDYEEGTFTPNWQGVTTGGTTGYSYNYGGYTKIGNTVHIRMYTVITSSTGSGTWFVTGLPFASVNSLYGITTGSCMLENYNWNNNMTWVVPYKNSNTSSLYLYSSGDSQAWMSLGIDEDVTFSIILGITYQAA